MPTSRRIISGIAIFIIASALAYAGIQCIRFAALTGSGFVALLGCVLFIAGVAFAIAAVAPIRIVEKIFGPHQTPNATIDTTERWSLVLWLLNLFS